MSQQQAKSDAAAALHTRPTTIRDMRKDAPVLVAEIDLREPGAVEFDAVAEFDTALAAIVLAHAGQGPIVVPEGFPSPLPKTVACASANPLDIKLGTGIVGHSLDRRPIVAAVPEICRRP